MKAVKHKSFANRDEHPAIPVYKEIPYKKLLDQGNCILVDSDEKEDGQAFFQNSGNTLVVALPELNDASNKDNSQIHEWIDDYMDLLMEAVAELKPDEFEIQPLEGMKGYSRIARFWWS